MELPIDSNQLFTDIIQKSTLKQNIYYNTSEAFQTFKRIVEHLVHNYPEAAQTIGNPRNVAFEISSNSAFEIGLKFGGDILIFVMHTNVFEIPRDNAIMRSDYIRSDKQRSYCGMINIYNFLADSFKYNRMQDIGYLIGRVYINKDNHYFIDGKRELGLIYNNFAANEMNQDNASKIIEAAVRYTLNFDLLVPPYEEVKERSVYDMRSTIDGFSLKTGKRLGFHFYEDKE